MRLTDLVRNFDFKSFFIRRRGSRFNLYSGSFMIVFLLLLFTGAFFSEKDWKPGHVIVREAHTLVQPTVPIFQLDQGETVISTSSSLSGLRKPNGDPLQAYFITTQIQSRGGSWLIRTYRVDGEKLVLLFQVVQSYPTSS